MISVKIICPGKLKESWLREACGEYSKRLSGLCSLEICEIAAVKLPDKPSAAEIERALKREGECALSKIPPNSRIYALCIEGKQFSSEELSTDISQAALRSAGSMVFLLGSSFGLSEEIKRRADVQMSMSKMTFPHQLARVMLLEQLYRAFSISVGGKYHK